MAYLVARIGEGSGIRAELGRMCVNLGTPEYTVTDDGDVTQELSAGAIYHFTGALTSLTVTLGSPRGNAIYHFDFACGETVPTLTLPETVQMQEGFVLLPEHRYEIDILNDYGVGAAWTL